MKFAKRFWRGKELGGKWELATSNRLSPLAPHLLAGQRDPLQSSGAAQGPGQGQCRSECALPASVAVTARLELAQARGAVHQLGSSQPRDGAKMVQNFLHIDFQRCLALSFPRSSKAFLKFLCVIT